MSKRLDETGRLDTILKADTKLDKVIIRTNTTKLALRKF